MNIIILGAPSSGKGTQAEKIAKAFHLFHFSSGDALRAEIASGSAMGEKIKSIMGQGELVSQDIVDELVKKITDEHEEIVFDGYPRTKEQAASLEHFTSIDAVLNIKVRDEEAIRRMSSRRVCNSCGASYNLLTKPPTNPELCDACGGKLIQREGDTPATIKKRLGVYHANTDLILKYYQEHGVTIHDIDGEQSIDEVFASIKRALKK